jgi:hypothetical protein
MKSICGTMFVKEQGIKGIAYCFFSLSGSQSFSMAIDASGYPKECWDRYHESVEFFVNSLTGDDKNEFWLQYKDSAGFINWHDIIELVPTFSAHSNFNEQLINNFIDDFNLQLLTCDS